MTILLNEIHLLDGFNKTFLVAAADRRITDVNGSYLSTRQKLFRIPYLHSTVSYFGLAEFIDTNRKRCHLSDFLPAFIRRNNTCGDLRSFVYILYEDLQRAIPSRVLGACPSGFHIAGYDRRFIPEFWFLTNIREMEGYQPSELKDSYKKPAPHFRERDARALGWDGSDPSSVVGQGVQIYRNGDFQGHAIVSDLLDTIFQRLRDANDFRTPTTLAEYRDYMQFKMTFLADLHRHYARIQRIGKPIDIEVWTADVQQQQVAWLPRMKRR